MHGLVALMEIQASRIPARLGPDGLPVPLPEQNRGRWDHLLIRRGFTALLRAQQLRRPPGPYVLQAAIAACHARARTGGETDWRQIAMLYEALAALTPSPVVELNRAVAVAMAGDVELGLRIADELAAGSELAGYHHLPSVRGDLLARLGRTARRRASSAAPLPSPRTIRNATCSCGGRTTVTHSGADRPPSKPGWRPREQLRG